MPHCGGASPAASSTPAIPANDKRQNEADIIVKKAVLNKYLDFGERGIADIKLESGERIMLSFAPSRLSLHRLYLFGFLPGRNHFKANRDDTDHMVRVLARTESELRPLPQAKIKHHDATPEDLKAAEQNRTARGDVDAPSIWNRRERPLALFSRLALTAQDASDLARLLERTRNTPA
jgi:hypothetical protein